MKSTLLSVLAISAALVTSSCKPNEKEVASDDPATSSESSSATPDTKVDLSQMKREVGLSQMKREVEQEFRRIFPQAIYRDLDTEHSDMSGFVSEMIGAAQALVDIYPERAGELQQWRKLQQRMLSYNRLKQQSE